MKKRIVTSNTLNNFKDPLEKLANLHGYSVKYANATDEDKFRLLPDIKIRNSKYVQYLPTLNISFENGSPDVDVSIKSISLNTNEFIDYRIAIETAERFINKLFEHPLWN